MKRMLKMIISICLIGFFSCNNDEKIHKLISTTGTGIDSICFHYSKYDSITLVKKIFYIGELKEKFNYYIIKKKNKIFVGSKNIPTINNLEEFKFQEYLSKHKYFSNSVYLDLGRISSSMEFIGVETFCLNGKKKILYKFYGQDIGVKSFSKNTYFFDTNFVLMRIEMPDGKNVLMSSEW